MSNFINTWGIFPWSIERGEQHIHPEDLEEIKTCFLGLKVFNCVKEENGFLFLKYGKEILRVLPELYKNIDPPKYCIGDVVEILNGSSQGEKAIIVGMYWHLKNQSVIYYLKIGEKVKSRRYWDTDIKSGNS
jgi:hypothetical protein